MLVQVAGSIPSLILGLVRRVDQALAQGSVEAARDAALESRTRRRMWGALVNARVMSNSTFVSGQSVGNRVS